MKKPVENTKSATPQAQAVQVLRKRAEEIARETADQSPEDIDKMSPVQIKQTIHELRVHQIELDMQNEELRGTRAELKDAWKRYFDLYDLAPVGYVTVSEKGLILEANLAAATLLGEVRGALVKYPLSRFILKEDQDIYYRLRKQLLETGKPQVSELRMMKKGGTVFWAHLEATAAKDSDGTPMCRVVLIDISERKRMESALQLSNERLAEAQKTAKIGDWEANLHTNELHWSPTIFDIFGLDSKSFQPGVKEFYKAVHPDDRDLVLESEERSEQTGLHDVVHRIVRPSGEIRFVHELARRYKDDQGKLIMLRGTAQDISDLKQAEARKVILESQNRQLQKADSLGRMAASIAHHFNNQLGVVIGNLEMAMMELPKGTPPVSILTTAMQAAWKAAEMSGLMLTYVGQSFDKRETLDISNVCQRSLSMLRNVMPGNVVLETDLPSPGPVISANTNQIQQVFTNLITNARESIGDSKGIISLKVKTVSPADISPLHRYPGDWQPKGNAYACLEVSDAGSGITDNDIEKLFDPFFSTKFTDRGMGLPVVLGIVKAHGGVITVESEPGRGSIFRVFFPISAEEIIRQPDKVAQSVAIAGSGIVLLVEDEEPLREMAAAMLKRLGFSVIEAKDGVEAVDAFRQRQNEIHFVISDLTMPRLDGWETLTALRKLKPGIPVILASGYDKAQVMAGDHPELPQAFLGKPYKLKGLSDAIGEALSNK